MNVLVAVRHPVEAWTLPADQVARLRARFPHITFQHSTSRETDLALAPEADVCFVLGISEQAIRAAGRLRWVQCSAHAVQHLALPLLQARGVVVTNARGVQSIPIAEHVLAGLLALARGLPRSWRDQQRHEWRPNDYVGEAMPWLVHGRTMGVIGVGSIGMVIATRARALGMRVIGMRRSPERGVPDGFDEVVGPDRLEWVLRTSDVLVLAAPHTAATDQLLDRAALGAMRQGSVLVNVARGQLVDEQALVEALQQGHLRGAVLDVTTKEPLPADHPLWTAPNVVLTPHTAGFRADHFDAVIELFAENLVRFERGAPLVNVVDPDAGY